jgi:predicted DNA-binding protein (MmcQ/YjbR family)
MTTPPASLPTVGPQLPRSFLLAKPGAEESYPFYPDVPVFKVVNKIFAIGYSKNDKWYLNLKAAPEDASILCSLFSEITPGYHMNKRHWVSVDLAGGLPSWEVERLINASYDLIITKLTKKQRLQFIGACYG